MKQEEKDLLLKDLCGRLPYGVKIALKNNGGYHHENIAKKGDVTIDELKGFSGTYFSIFHKNPNEWYWYDDIDVEDIKPYLFPLSSMTEEQKEEMKENCLNFPISGVLMPTYKTFDFFNKHHIDFRGLIDMGLAIDATGLNIYIKIN